MNQTINFTPSQLLTLILGVCAAISCVGGALAWIVKGADKLKAPERRQDERLTDLEKRMARHDEMLDNDNKRLETIEEGTRVTQRAILALLTHGIDGNEIETMKSAKDELTRYLIER